MHCVHTMPSFPPPLQNHRNGCTSYQPTRRRDSMNPTANMGWAQGQAGGVCGPNGQLSVVATVWGVTTSTQSAPMGSYSQMGNSYCNSGVGGGNSAYNAPAGSQMAMTKGSYGAVGGTGRHMGTGYAGYVSVGIYCTYACRFWGQPVCLLFLFSPASHMPENVR